MSQIVVVDYGMGNLRSVVNACRRACPDKQVELSSDPALIRQAERIIFPGQGAMPDCMAQLRETGLDEALREAAAEKPFLGICIGLQMLFSQTEEGNVEGLNLLPGRIKRFPAGMEDSRGLPLKIPQMGWNQVKQVKVHPLWSNIDDKAWFYFVHSYYLAPEKPETVYGETTYGFPYACAIGQENLFAVQFHPEKSGTNGLQLLYNFSLWQPFTHR